VSEAAAPLDARRASRRQALELSYQADVRGQPVASLLAQRGPEAQPDELAAKLVFGVEARRDELNAVIDRHAHGWSLERMPVIDRNLLRLGVFELMHTTTPTAVVVNEAVELAKELSTEDSARFVNGLLAAAARER
jgi:N utilization substance protein B